MNAPFKPTVSLVIGSGSVKCAASIGVVKALAEAGIGIDRVVGCSAGALFATMVALGYDIEKCKEVTTKTWTRQLTSQPHRMSLLRALAPKLFGFKADSFGLRDSRLVEDVIRAALGNTRFEDLPIPLHITATDFSNGELVELSSGRIADAILASLALPLVFKPVSIDGRLLVDGYLADPLPVSVAMRHCSQVIVAIGFESPYQDKVNSAGRFAFQLSAILANNLLKAKLAFHGATHHSEMLMILPEFTRERVRLFDTEKLPYIIEEGEKAMRQQLPYLQELLGVAHA
jgi:NTE family protein